MHKMYSRSLLASDTSFAKNYRYLYRERNRTSSQNTNKTLKYKNRKANYRTTMSYSCNSWSKDIISQNCCEWKKINFIRYITCRIHKAVRFHLKILSAATPKSSAKG